MKKISEWTIPIIDFLKRLLNPVFSPLLESYNYCKELVGGQKTQYSFRFKAVLATALGVLLYISIVINGIIGNLEWLAKFMPANQKVELVTRNINEINSFFESRNEAGKQKNCKELATFELDFVFGDENYKSVWLKDCQNDINNIITYDLLIYKYPRLDEENRAEVRGVEIIQKRNNGRIDTYFYERNIWIEKHPDHSIRSGNWLISDSTRNLLVSESREFKAASP